MKKLFLMLPCGFLLELGTFRSNASNSMLPPKVNNRLSNICIGSSNLLCLLLLQFVVLLYAMLVFAFFYEVFNRRDQFELV